MQKAYTEFQESLFQFYFNHHEDYDGLEQAIDAFVESLVEEAYSPERLEYLVIFSKCEARGMNKSQITDRVKSVALLETAIRNPLTENYQDLINASLDYWPENYDAIIYSVRHNVYDKMIKVQELIEKHIENLSSDKIQGWAKFEERPFLRLAIYQSAMYVRNGLYKRALPILERVDELDPNQESYARQLLMVAYTYDGCYDEVIELYKETPHKKNEAGYIIGALMSAILASENEIADQLFDKLMVEFHDEMAVLLGSGEFDISTMVKMSEITRLTDPKMFYNSFANFNSLIITSIVVKFYFYSSYERFKLEEERNEELSHPTEKTNNVIDFSKSVIDKMKFRKT